MLYIHGPEGARAVETGVLELKNNLSAILQDVESGKTDRVVVKRYGKPVAQIVPYEPEE